MFADDIALVHEMVAKYGLVLPLADLGGLKAQDLTVADYAITIQRVKDGADPLLPDVQHARYLRLTQNPFEDIAPGYLIVNPQYGDAVIEEIHDNNAFGTIVCLSVLEHVRQPFDVMYALWRLLKPGGLLILSTEFSFPYHPSPEDNWRFTPSGLRILAEEAGFDILECGWRLDIPADAGVREIHTLAPQEIKTVYIVARARRRELP